MKYTVQEALKIGQNLLNEKEIPIVEARFMMEWILKKNFTELISVYQDQLSEVHFSEFLHLIEERLQHVPLQYLLGHQNFYGHDFFVDQRVLIPRPETELLVEMVIAYLKDFYKSGKRKLSILDLCTGSGCIIISIAKYFSDMNNIYPDMEIFYYGADISAGALEVAMLNEDKIIGSKRITWCKGDLFEAMSTNEQQSDERFDVIVSNPPYISPSDIVQLSPEVKDFEPTNALDGGTDGLDFYKKISSEAGKWLYNKGKIYFEIGKGQMNDIVNIMECNGFQKVTGEYDFYECERIVHGVFLKEA